MSENEIQDDAVVAETPVEAPVDPAEAHICDGCS